MTQRRRAHKLDLENRKLLAANKHKSMDIASLKSALSNRDAQLQSLQDKINRFESVLTEVSGRHRPSVKRRCSLKRLTNNDTPMFCMSETSFGIC